MELEITQFNGMANDDKLWSKGYARYCVATDVWGLGDNVNKISKPGVLQIMKIMGAESEAAATNDVTDTIKHFAYFSGSVWGMSAEASPRLYERVLPWTLRRSTSGSDLATAQNSGNLASFAGSLWVAQNTRISRWTGSVWTQSFAALNSTTEHPMKVFSGKLYIADGRYVNTIDSTPTFVNQVLTLPAEFTIRSMEVFGDRLYIFADTGVYSRLFIWNGTDTTFQSYFDLDHSTAPYIVYSDGILWIVPPINNSASTPIYTFNGSSFQKILNISGLSVQTNRDAVVSYRSGILIASNNSSQFEDGTAGLWYLGRSNDKTSFQLGLAFNPAGGVTTSDVGGIITYNSNILVGTQNSSTYEVWESLVSDTATNTSSIWQSLPIDAGSELNKTWHYIQLNSELKNNTNATVVIKYRLNYATSWTTLKTVNASDVKPDRIIPIKKQGDVIEIRFELTTPASSYDSTKLHGFILGFSPNRQ